MAITVKDPPLYSRVFEKIPARGNDNTQSGQSGPAPKYQFSREWVRWFQQEVAKSFLLTPESGTLIANRLVGTDASAILESITNLALYILGATNIITVTDNGDGTVTIDISNNYLPNAIDGTVNQITVTDNLDGTITLSTPQDIATDSDVQFSSLTLDNTGLHLLDTNASHDLIIAPGSDLTADHTLTLTTGDADRTITLSGNPTLSDWFDQAVKAASSPTFANLTIGLGIAATDYTLTFDGETNDGIITWMEDEDYFKFSDEILLDSAEKIFLRDTAIGIYSQSDTFLDLFADGGIRIGDSSAGAPTNYILISPAGNLEFRGTAKYIVAANSYAFVAAADNDAGLFFNNTGLKYEFRDTSAAVSASIGVNSGDGYFKGDVGIKTTTPDTTLQVVGTTKFGDDNTNYMTSAADGEVTLVGTARVAKKLTVEVAAVKGAGVAPTAATIGVTPVLQFSQAVTQSVYTAVHIPNDWDASTDITIHVHWAPVNGNAGDVVWDIDYTSLASESNEVLTAGVTNLTVTDSTQSLQDEVLQTADMTMTAASLAVEDIVSLQIYRDTGDEADTYAAAAAFIRLDVEYVSNKLGAAT